MKNLMKIVLLIALGLTSVQASGKRAPFLIMGTMPHLTKLVKMNWNDHFLALNDVQKKKLLIVRKVTMSGVAKIKKALAPLEKSIATGIMSGKTAESLMLSVQKVAKLKAEATKIHLECIYNTKAILNKEQLTFLLQGR